MKVIRTADTTEQGMSSLLQPFLATNTDTVVSTCFTSVNDCYIAMVIYRFAVPTLPMGCIDV